MNSSFTPGAVLVTSSNEAEARKLAETLVEERLAACVKIFPVQSVYRWQGKVCQDSEWQLLIKTDLGLFDRLARRIKDLHSYEVPETVGILLERGSPAYLEWMAAQSQPLDVAQGPENQ